MPSNCGAGEDPWESLGQKGNQTSQFKGNQPENSLEGLMLKLKLQYFGDANSWLIGKVPDAGTWTWANFGRWWRTGRPGVLQPMGLQRVRHDWVTEQQQQLQCTRPCPFGSCLCLQTSCFPAWFSHLCASATQSPFCSLKLQVHPQLIALALPFTLLEILFPNILTWLTSTGFQKASKK